GRKRRGDASRGFRALARARRRRARAGFPRSGDLPAARLRRLPRSEFDRACAGPYRAVRPRGASDRRAHRDRRRGLHPRLDPAAEARRRRGLRPGDAQLPGRSERGRHPRAHRVHQVHGCAMNAALEPARASYLTEGYSLRSWLTTTDHKRIAILYAIAITAFFFLGGAAATLIRLELATPAGDLVSADTYNKLFTLHGVVMVWFFLIPSIPATLGNFLVPLMIGAREVAFPRLNLLSWYIYVLGGAFTV